MIAAQIICLGVVPSWPSWPLIYHISDLDYLIFNYPNFTSHYNQHEEAQGINYSPLFTVKSLKVCFMQMSWFFCSITVTSQRSIMKNIKHLKSWCNFSFILTRNIVSPQYLNLTVMHTSQQFIISLIKDLRKEEPRRSSCSANADRPKKSLLKLQNNWTQPQENR